MLGTISPAFSTRVATFFFAFFALGVPSATIQLDLRRVNERIQN